LSVEVISPELLLRSCRRVAVVESVNSSSMKARHKKANSNERCMRAATVCTGYADLHCLLLDRQTHSSHGRGEHIRMHWTFVHLA
jgi:hypothetical protein